MKRHLMIALILTSCALPLQSATLERLSLDDMIGKATAVVRGTVSDSWTAFTGRDIYTHYKIQIGERFKGPVQPSVEITVPGGAIGQLRQTVSGSPVLNKGDQYVFFLWKSRSGVTWILGLTQGLFALPSGGAVDPIATRAANRELMLDPSTARPVRDNAVSIKLSDLRARIAAKLGQAGLQ